MKKSLSRRDLLAGAAGAVGAAALGSTAGDLKAQAGDTTAHPGPPASELGGRSSHEHLSRVRTARGTSSRTPLQDLQGTITPADLHFERHHAGIPDIDPNDYRLLIHGMVKRPTVFTLDDLKRFPATSQIYFLECSGNFMGRNAGPETTPQNICGMTSQSEWAGVALSTLLREVGADPGATWFLAEGQDAAVMTRSIPMDKARDDALIVYAQNGEPLRPAQGYPARLFLPGWEGNANVKWLRRIELADRPFMTREETSKYTDPLSDGTARQFSFEFDARSIITAPVYPDSIEQGWIEIRGIAWSGRGRISRVEVTTDRGQTWQAARLQKPVLPKAHVRFRHLWNWDGSETEIMSRAVDETGYVQPTREALLEARGRRAKAYHLNPVTGWNVRSTGQVFYRSEPTW